jgi:hypothetical protein
MDARETAFSIHRTALFDQCLKDLRKKGGTPETAAKKAEDFIRAVSGQDGRAIREKFSFTRHGEARIRNCRKIDLSAGYRLVSLLKDGQLVLLYAGSHDECSRWLMRNRRMNYEFNEAEHADSASRELILIKETEPAVLEGDKQCIDEYEADLMSKIDDTVLRKVFSGIVNGRSRVG